MTNTMPGLTEERLKSLLKYNPDTGVWTWMVTRNHRSRAGSRAGTIHRTGYRIIEIDGKSYRSARLAHLYMTGSHSSELIDHIDHQKDNDAWDNLRQASQNQNQYNQNMRIDNTSGVKGVRWEKQSGKWRADIKFQGKSIYLGLFTTIEAATDAITSARTALHKEFAFSGLKDDISGSPQPSITPQIDNDGWIKWRGGECAPVTGIVEAKWSDGRLTKGEARDWRWCRENLLSSLHIIAYRLIENDGREG